MATSDPWQKDENRVVHSRVNERLAPIELAWIEHIKGRRRRIGGTFMYKPIIEKGYVESMGALR